MGKLIKKMTVKVVGVSFNNADGTSRQKYISKLHVGDPILLKYYKYKNEPAYAVTTASKKQIGNISKDLANTLFKNYNNCYFVSKVNEVIGGKDGNYYGCIISISIYDSAPEKSIAPRTPAPKSAPVKKGLSPKAYNAYGIFFIVFSIPLILMSFLLLLVDPFWGCAFILFGVFIFLLGCKYRKIAKKRSSNK